MKKILILTVLVMCSVMMRAQEEGVKRKTIVISASYTGDNAYNFLGGIQTGYAYLGMVNLMFDFDTEKARIWKGGTFFIKATNTHGACLSADLLGDMQVASNIEAGNQTFLQELWYRQIIRKMELTIGLQDLNAEFANTDHGLLFLNSSFGILPVISANIAAPIFPLTSPGITLKWHITEKIRWIGAVYDGCPTAFHSNPYNVRWQFNQGDGLLAITEFQLDAEMGKLPGTYKAGVYSHHHFIEKKFIDNFPDTAYHAIFGAYICADQKIWSHNERCLSVFLQTGYSPSETSVCNAYLGAGLHFTGLLTKAKDDILGLAVACEHFKGKSGFETALELTWQKNINEHFYIQPDLQFIIQPSGKLSGLDNCLAGVIRLGLSF